LNSFNKKLRRSGVTAARMVRGGGRNP